MLLQGLCTCMRAAPPHPTPAALQRDHPKRSALSSPGPAPPGPLHTQGRPAMIFLGCSDGEMPKGRNAQWKKRPRQYAQGFAGQSLSLKVSLLDRHIAVFSEPPQAGTGAIWPYGLSDFSGVNREGTGHCVRHMKERHCRLKFSLNITSQSICMQDSLRLYMLARLYALCAGDETALIMSGMQDHLQSHWMSYEGRPAEDRAR